MAAPSIVSDIFSLSFNQDQDCISCGTSSGYRIYHIDPLKELFRREFDTIGRGCTFNRINQESAEKLSPKHQQTSLGSEYGRHEGPRSNGSKVGFSEDPLRNKLSKNKHRSNGDADDPVCGTCDGFTVVEMLYRTNLVALVSPGYASNKVVIWDDHEGICTGELLFRSAVRAVRMQMDRIVVVLEHRICVYNVSDLRLIHQVDTVTNARGVCALSGSPKSCALACLGLRTGEVRIVLYESKKSLLIKAHTSEIACISLSYDGTLLATASTRGTLIRVFNTADGSKIQELRRGADPADIYCIAFSRTNHWLAVSSDKGTVHIFCLNETARRTMHRSSCGYVSFPSSLSPDTTPKVSSGISNSLQLAGSSLMSFARANAGSSLWLVKGVLPSYFSSEWSFAQFRLHEERHALVAFGKDRNSVIILCSNGSYYKCSFDPIQGGEMVIDTRSNLFDAPFVT